MPYFLAPLWDVELAARKQAEDERKRLRQRQRRFGGHAQQQQQQQQQQPRGKQSGVPLPKDEGVGFVPKELRRTLKRSKGAKGLLIELEEEVRRFVVGWEERQRRQMLRQHGDQDERGKGHTPKPSFDSILTGGGSEESDEEIVFVGRNGGMRDVPASPTTRRASGDVEEVVHGMRRVGLYDGMYIDSRYFEG